MIKMQCIKLFKIKALTRKQPVRGGKSTQSTGQKSKCVSCPGTCVNGKWAELHRRGMWSVSSALMFSLTVLEELSSSQWTQQHLQTYQGINAGISFQNPRSRNSKEGAKVMFWAAFQAILMHTQVQCHCSTPTVVQLPFISSVVEDVSQGKIPHRMDGMRAFSTRSAIASGILKRSRSIGEPEMQNHLLQPFILANECHLFPDGKQ